LILVDIYIYNVFAGVPKQKRLCHKSNWRQFQNQLVYWFINETCSGSYLQLTILVSFPEEFTGILHCTSWFTSLAASKKPIFFWH